MAGSAALGANLLTRLTTGMDLLAVCLFLLFTAWLTNVRGSELRSRAIRYVKIAFPIYGVFFLIDRAYQYVRFGSFFNTYPQLFGQEWKRLDPSLPAAFPFETPFRLGFFGALFTPEKSIFLFDPLLLLGVIIAAFAWKNFRPEVKAYFAAFGALLFAYVSFYAKYTDWSGDTAWGDRYVTTAAQFVALMAVPLLLRHRAEVGKVVWRAGLAIMIISVVIQLCSVAFWCPLERYQMETLSPPTFVVGLRLKTLWLGQFRADERFQLVPDAGIALDFGVGFHEEAVVPGILVQVSNYSAILTRPGIFVPMEVRERIRH